MHPDDGRVVSNFIVQALRGEDITIYGDGHQTRSFCYVDDLVKAMIAMMNTDGLVTGPINIGNPDEIHIAQLAKLVIEMTRSRSRLVHKALPIDDPRQRRPDITLAREVLGWEPSVHLRAGLTRTIRYFDQLLQADGITKARNLASIGTGL